MPAVLQNLHSGSYPATALVVGEHPVVGGSWKAQEASLGGDVESFG